MNPNSNISSELRNFDTLLSSVLSGKKRGVVQIRDIAYFKRIKRKIESYPLLNEIFAEKSAQQRQTHSSQDFIQRGLIITSDPPKSLIQQQNPGVLLNPVLK